MNKKTESILISWCDSGMVSGAMADSLINSILLCQKFSFRFDDCLRVVGNQISRQRHMAIEKWINNYDSDWLLIIDSDVIINPEGLYTLISSADKDIRPIVTGIYPLLFERENIQTIYPSAYKFKNTFYDHDTEYMEQYIIKNINKNSLIEIDGAGLGYCLIHRSVIDKIKSVADKDNMFKEYYINGNFISEDVSFFINAKNAGYKIFLQTAAVAHHQKNIFIDPKDITL